MPLSGSQQSHGLPSFHDSWNARLRFVLRICSGCPLDIRLFFAAGAGEPELEEESSSFAEGAVRCGFKGMKDWGTERVGLEMKKKLGYTCDTHT